MADVVGVDAVIAQLGALGKKVEETVSVVVGFQARYAIFVHENLEARHRIGQAKYLEQPAREMAPELGLMVGKLVKSGMSLEKALVVAGLRLQRAAQQLTPVDTGNLKNSAFTAVEPPGGIALPATSGGDPTA